ncbi:hypothetical protein TNCV_657271 [Trichonephila clavipes]|nr:hypothetical protein TNCV_657271 [Trichonephila clavipes]
MNQLPSPRSRRRKTSKPLDVMDTDADPFDTEYVTGLASEEDESLLEADFQQGYDTGGKTLTPTYSYSRADWALFTQLAVIPDAIVKTESVDTAVQEVTNVLIAAADLSIQNDFKSFIPTLQTLVEC